MSVVNLYDSLEGTKTSGGTWAYEGTDVTAPAPPGVYNGNVDFSGTNPGTHVYSYTVTYGECETVSYLTVELNDGVEQVNDDCAGATAGGKPGGLPINFTWSGNNSLGSCPGLLPAENSGVALPSEWQADATGGDLWFKILVPHFTGNPDVGIVVLVNGVPYGLNSIATPNVAVYYGSCGALTQLEAGYGGLQSTIVYTSIADASLPTTVYVRVGSQAGSEGLYDVQIQLSENIA